MSRTIEMVPLGDLKADPRNPKDHDVGTIRSSIDRFGTIDAIVRDDRTGFIVSGHGRTKALTAMQEAGQQPPEGVQLDADGNWLVPVITGWSSRSDTEAAAALIGLNRTTELGGWVDESLLELLGELAEVPDGLDGVGYHDSDIEALRASFDEVPDFDPDDSGISRLDQLDARPCQKCGYDVANNPENLSPWSD